MPTTYNGIGTHYYGKKNVSIRRGTCRSCGRVCDLTTYDTRLWFVIIFIPVIPLGRKKILDQCSVCQRHYVAKADEYEQNKQLQVSGSMDSYRRSPSPEAALQVHAVLLGFHEHSQAGEFRATVLDRFPQHAGLRAGLAGHLQEVSSYQEVPGLYEAALQLDPELPEARVGVAQSYMAQGKLDEARELLDFLELPGAGQAYPLGPIDRLAGYYQRAGRHEETLEICRILLRELPNSGSLSDFRKFVKKSEKALKQKESILPQRKHSFLGFFRSEGSPYSSNVRNAFKLGLGVSILAIGLAINNEYIRTHRAIRVMNATGQPVQVSVDNQPAQTFGVDGKIYVEEGNHQLRLTGPVNETVDVHLQAGYFDRWTNKPAWILNPGGEAVFEQATIYYAVNPQPPSSYLLLGQKFISIPHVDYAFETPPNSLKVDNKNSQVQKIALRMLQGQDLGVFNSEINANREVALNFAESRLRRNFGGYELFDAYTTEIFGHPQEIPRLQKFLEEGIKRRPIEVDWHRAYQSATELADPTKDLVALYDEFLAAEPMSGALIYLRGRIDPDLSRRDDYYRRSIEADPTLGWPWMALAGRAAGRAQWDEAIRCIQKAEELKIKDDQVATYFHIAKLGKGEAKELVERYRAKVMASPFDLRLLLFLVDALAVSGETDQIIPAVDAWENRIPVELRSMAVPGIRAMTEYMMGNPQASLDLSASNPMLARSVIWAHSLLATGRVDEIGDDPAVVDKLSENPWNSLSISLGFELEGKQEEAKKWREKGIQTLESLTTETKKIAKMIGTESPISPSDFDDVLLDPENKAMVLTLMAERFPDQRSEYLAESAKFNLQRKAPYLLVKRALDTRTKTSQ